jgi:hypothetical protein
MSIFTRRSHHRDAPAPPAPIVTGTGPYRLHDYTSGDRVRCEQRFESLAAAMIAAGSTDPDDWFALAGSDRISQESRAFMEVGRYMEVGRQQVVDAPGVGDELLILQKQTRAAERQREADEAARRQAERKADWALWKAARAAEKAWREAKDAAKPRLIISYLTVAGQALGDADLRVKVVTQPGHNGYDGHTETAATCTACGASHTIYWGWDGLAAEHGEAQDHLDEGGQYSTPKAQAWALEHAETCRAIPPKETR